MNRDKTKFQYTKQEIPDNLKYHSDDSDSSEFSQIRKSKKLNNNNQILLLAVIVSFLFVLSTGISYGHSRFGIEFFSLILLLKLLSLFDFRLTSSHF